MLFYQILFYMVFLIITPAVSLRVAFRESKGYLLCTGPGGVSLTI